MRGRRIEIELLFSKKAAAWVKGRIWHPSQETSLTKDGRLKTILKVADNDELVGWILSFGSHVGGKQARDLEARGKRRGAENFSRVTYYDKTRDLMCQSI
jgi:hypothetical protein